MEGRVFEEKSLQLQLPFGMMVSGPSSSGKSTLVLRLLKDYKEMITPVPQEVLYCYGEYSCVIPSIQRAGIRVHEGLPNDEVIDSCRNPLLLVCDDLMTVANDKYLTELYTKKSHHRHWRRFSGTKHVREVPTNSKKQLALPCDHAIPRERSCYSHTWFTNVSRQVEIFHGRLRTSN